MNEKINAVIVTRNRKKLFFECIKSILGQSRKVDRIIIVDNDSSDGTQESFNKKYGSNKIFDYIHLKKNTGPSGGFYYGMKRAYDLGADWVWIMDDDCEPEKNSLKELVKAQAFLKGEGKRIGFLASSVYLPNGKMINVPMISRKIDEDTGEINSPEFLYKGLLKVQNATFVSLLYSRDFISKNGFPIKEMFIWGDDTEYSYRASSKYDCYLVGESKVIHKKPAGKLTTILEEKRKEIVKLYYLYYRNNMYTIRKYETNSYFIIRMVNWLTLKPLKCLFSPPFRFRKFGSVFFGTLSGLFYNPKVKVPRG